MVRVLLSSCNQLTILAGMQLPQQYSRLPVHRFIKLLSALMQRKAGKTRGLNNVLAHTNPSCIPLLLPLMIPL